jgi:hypothetical protein
MKYKTFEEMTKHVDFKDGLEIEVNMPNIYTFKGKIVGIASRGLVPNYLVECTDGFLPNETYPYKVASIPLSYIFTL